MRRSIALDGLPDLTPERKDFSIRSENKGSYVAHVVELGEKTVVEAIEAVRSRHVAEWFLDKPGHILYTGSDGLMRMEQAYWPPPKKSHYWTTGDGAFTTSLSCYAWTGDQGALGITHAPPGYVPPPGHDLIEVTTFGDKARKFIQRFGGKKA